MNYVHVIPGYSLATQERLLEVSSFLMPEQNALLQAAEAYHQSPYDFMRLPFDQLMLDYVLIEVERIKKKQPQLIVVIGIGGSYAGSYALHQALYGLCNSSLLFADSLETRSLMALLKEIKECLETKGMVACIIISKSGTTTETIANAQIILSLLQEYNSDYYQWVSVITDKNSPLWRAGEYERFTLFEIPKGVGGRFSVLSPVGLVPLALRGISIDSLCKGASQAVEMLAYPNSLMARSAAFIYTHYHDYSLPVHDTFLFSLQCEGLGKWYRQLMGESLGKKNKEGTRYCGIVPTVSLGTLDLHSVGQLYLGGAPVASTMFVTVADDATLDIPGRKSFYECGPFLQERSVSMVAQAIIEGVQQAYQDKNRPFMTLHFSELSEKSLGFFVQMKMMEIYFIAVLLGVDAFDQPNVETYKSQTRRILARE